MSSEEHNIADYEEVLRVLPESFRETWKDNTDVLVYLAELGSLGLQRLSKEPDKLAEERISILEQTQDLAFHNYKTFIQAAECSHKIFQDFNKIEFRLNSLVDNLPVFKEKCAEFGKEAQRINTRWRQASSTLAKHPQLLEFLEMPQLMDTYVRNGYYDEALELSAYVKRLERKHKDIPLIKSIVQDVQASTNVMLSHLLTKLRTNIQLPDCLKVVGYLRRMDVFNDSELRIKFLQARDAWFQKVINDIDKSDAYEHVIKVIESSRVHLFDITTQYRAIFSDDDPLLLVREDSKNNCAIFHSWIIWKISWFLDVLEKDILADLGGRIDSVLAQCMYFGLSFSRVNIDFRPLLIPVFQNIALKKFCSSVQRATFKFEKIMEAFAFTMYTNTTLLVTTLSQDNLQPPAVLLDFYPLAQYCNDILGALNEMKLCCSFAMSNDAVTSLSNSLSRLVNVLITIHSKRSRRMSELEIENFNKFCFLLSSDLVPHLNKCLFIIFPPEAMCATLGITPLEFKKYEHMCKLNISMLLEPLQVILPSKDDDDVGLTFSVQNKDAEKQILAEQNKNIPCNDETELNKSSNRDKDISDVAKLAAVTDENELAVVTDEKNSNVEVKDDILHSDIESDSHQDVEQTEQIQEMSENVLEVDRDKID
ncbi:Conserved oligomeric Golgi complex subunit 8 [Araneus ventricosus]|uniref:Conserved oligomeric Golgi complex subunit 8 n=1 Tax=Araneus ventricosus TaxID=182803 RepID=A0A4Y2FJ40_ARAVE|nr:Conserved oligomeric Golgi complex subunit 8 [Araneus ventricosus]